MLEQNSSKIPNITKSLKVAAICVTILGAYSHESYLLNADAKKINDSIAQAHAEQKVLLICSPKGEVHKITIEIAKTTAQQQKGLMFRTKLEKNHGMLFIHKKPRIVKMWMKNTFIPLDMIFIDKNGEIVKIVERARPMSLDVISSSVKVIAVLEILGGSAHRLGISTDDKVKYRELHSEQ